ncbi:hypothetical protein Tco_1456793 [Tanacetum coccineum]
MRIVPGLTTRLKFSSTSTPDNCVLPFARSRTVNELNVQRTFHEPFVYDGPPVMPEDPYAYVVAAFQSPPSPDYVPGPEYPSSPDFVPELVYPEFMPPEDEEDDDEDPEEDPVDYPADEGDDGDDEDESSDDDEDDDVDIEEEEEEEEHPAPANSTTVALPTVDRAPSAEETEPFETDESATTPPPHLAYRVTARISIRDEPPTPFWSDTEVARLLAIPTPPPSPLSPWSSPFSPWSSLLPQIPSPPLPVSSPIPMISPSPPASPIRLLGYQAAIIRLRAEAPSTSHSLPLPPPIILSHTRSNAPSSGTPPLLPIPLPTSHHLCIYSLLTVEQTDPRLTYRLGRERDVGNGITDTWDEMLVDMPGAPATNNTKLGRRMTEFTTRVRQDTDEIYTRLDDEQSERQLMAGRLNMLYRDRRAHARTARLMEADARIKWHQKEPWNTAPETTNTTSVTNDQLQAMIDQGVTATLAARDADRNTNGDDSHNSGTGVRNRVCFPNSVIVTVENQVKFATCTLHSVALTWWNTHVKTVGHDAAYGVMTDKLYHAFRLACCAGKMVSQESDKIKKYVGGLPDMIHGSVVASKPKTMQDAVEIATELMDKKIRTFAERQTESKRKFEDTSRNTQNQQQQQQQNKRQNTGRAYTAGTSEKKQYRGSKPLCSKCNYHHNGPCAPRCHKFNKVGHLARDCRSTATANNANNQRGIGSG